MKLKNVLIVHADSANAGQKSTLETVKNALKAYKISYKLAARDRLSKAKFQNMDMIVAVGGDGTFLRAAQFIGNQPLLGVNSDIENKEGFFMQSYKRDFKAKLKKIIDSDVKIKKLPRLEAWINNKKIETLALNEFFIGPRKSYHSAKYIVQADEKKERQKSSGILITTPAGSHAWASACCSTTLPLDSKKYQFVVREPYEGKVFKNYRLKYGVLDKNQKISVISEMLDGILIADSVGREYSFKNGSKATIKLSNNHLNVLWLK